MLAPTKEPAPADFAKWLETQDSQDRIFLCTVSVHEIEKGIALLIHKGATAKAAELQAWLIGLVSNYDDKILPIDVATSSLSGKMEAASIASGHNPGMADALIAGIAKHHDLTVVTGNVRHFKPFGVDLLAPDGCRG